MIHTGDLDKGVERGLRKLLDYQVISRTEFRARILRMEYELTATGQKLAQIIEQIRDLDQEHGVSCAQIANHTRARRKRGTRSS